MRPTSTRVFISATSGDLGSVRQLAKEALLTVGCHPVEQTNFPPDYRKVSDMLKETISACHAVIHIVGKRYGEEPNPTKIPGGTSRRSYTQLENDLARQLNKKVYIFLCADTFPFDDCIPESVEKYWLQKAYRDQIINGDQISTTVESADELARKIRELQLELEEVRGHVHRRTIWIIVAITLLFALLGGVIYGVSRLGEKVEVASKDIRRLKQLEEERASQRATDFKIQQQFSVRFLDNLIRDKNLPVEEARQRALADLPAMTGLTSEEIQAIIDDRISILAEDGAAMPLERARAKLTIADYDGVLNEASANRSVTRELEMIAGAAALAKFRDDPQPKWNELAALSFHRALELSDIESDPIAWSDAAVWEAYVLKELTRFEESETLLRRALKLKESILGSGDPIVAVVLNNLAQLLQETNRIAEAESLMKRALSIDEKALGAEHSDVARDLNNLALLLQATNRPIEAEPLMLRVVTIFEKLYGDSHANVAIALNNLAQLFLDTSRLAEAEPLLRRALAIDEKENGKEHPSVAAGLTNLAHLLKATDRLEEAESLMRRAWAIDEKAYGMEHPEVATDLNNLCSLLLAANRPSEAEPLIRRALAIDEKTYGMEHTSVAGDLNNLAQLLKAMDRVEEAEPLSWRMVTIYSNFGKVTGHEHPNMQRALQNYHGILIASGLNEDEANAKIKSKLQSNAAP